MEPVTQPRRFSERNQTQLSNLSRRYHAFLPLNRADVQSPICGSLQDFVAVETIKGLCRILAGYMRIEFNECVMLPCK